MTFRSWLRALALMPLLIATSAPAERILFVGNSFTFGALSPVMQWNGGSVTDLNREGIGGVPALVKRFADQSGLHFDVSLETAPGKWLGWHLANRKVLLDRSWDRVVLQEYSTLDPDRPGDPTRTIANAATFARMLRARNSRVRIGLVATWSRPDLTYPPGKPWSGKPIQQMALDIRRGDNHVRQAIPGISVVGVGEAFNCAMTRGIADPNPYDGLAPGTLDLWASDHYHASTAGYYLEALTVFAGLTGRDPRRLGPRETAAAELGLAPALARRLQGVAFDVAIRGRCPSRESR